MTEPARILLRLPPSMHEDLKQRAAAEGISLNLLLVGLIAGAIGWPAV
jgi:predicted HicB family RNase H-like nuclease